MEILIIKNSDIVESLSFNDCIDVIESAFVDYEIGDSYMPHKIYLNLPEYHGDFRAMPSFSRRFNIAGIKWVNAHPDNIHKGLPNVMATMLVNNPATGELIALMEATALTALRTGAAGALGVKYGSTDCSNTMTFIGAGEQAKTQFNCINIIRPCHTITIFDPNLSASDKLKQHIETTLEADVILATCVEEAVSDADIIVTTTPSTSPIIKKEWLKPSAHINAIGADAKGKQECDYPIIKDAQIVVDDVEQATKSGEINTAIQKKIITPNHISATLGELITKKKQIDKNKLTLFDSTGLAIQDLALAGYYLKLSQFI